MEELSTKMEELLQDEAFLDAMFSSESSEDVRKLFAEKGIQLTLEEVDALGDEILKAVPLKTGDLSEEDLDSVAGGAIRVWLPRIPFPLPLPRPRPYPLRPWQWPRRK